MCSSLLSISSPYSSDYALGKTAVENSNWYRNDAAEAIMKNFYLDDLPKSVKDEKYAKHLIRRIQKMCSNSRFNLTKFISNNKLLLMSIPENHWREGIKKCRLSKWRIANRKSLMGALKCRSRSALFQTEFESRAHNWKKFAFNI